MSQTPEHSRPLGGQPDQAEVVPDFIFGTLATDALRLERLKQQRAGLWHDLQPRPHDPQPGQPIRLAVGVGPGVAADRLALYYSTDGSQPLGERGQPASGSMAVQLERVAVEWDTLLWGYGELWQGELPPQPEGCQVRYCIEAWQSAAPAAPAVCTAVYSFVVDSEVVPDWLHEAVIYHIFVDRFAPDPGADFATPADPLAGLYGGTLRGIISRLDYLAQLGVTCVWLSPIFPSPTHHGYDATDYGAIEPRLGSEADLRALLDAAHARGMRVLLDYVASHCSNQHPAFLAALQDQQAETAGWFSFEEWPTHYRSFFGVREMPQFDTDHPGARSYLVEHACRWLALGVDGFRLDYANGPSHAFWSAFRAATRATRRDCIMLGEVVETPELQRSYAGRMDGCLDFLLLQALRGFFAGRSLAPSQFASFLRRHYAFFPAGFALPSFLDNHDMNRFLWMVQGDQRRLRLAALCQFTLPGPPIIYYGSEVGLSQRRDVRYPDGSGHPEEARRPMLWGEAQDQQLLAFYRALVALRRSGLPDWLGPHQLLLVDDQRGLLAYRCGPFAVVLNNGPQQQELALPDWAGAELLLASAPGVAWHAGSLQLPAYCGACLR